MEIISTGLAAPWSIAFLDDTPLVLRETGSVTRQTLEREMHQAGLRIRPAIQVEGREAAREAVVVGIGVGVVSASEFGADSRVYAMPIRDCTQRMKETLVCLKEQSSRRVVVTFLEIVRESLREDQPEANSKNA